MKKRLMSAFLALAMMLTLLPVSVFAAGVTAGSAATSTATINFGNLKPANGWKTGDTVTVTSTGSANLNINFTYGTGAVGADTTVIPKPGNGGTVARTEEKQDGASTDSQTVAASTTVELPRFFAGSSDWTASNYSPYTDAKFDGVGTVTLTSSAATIDPDSFGTVTAKTGSGASQVTKSTDYVVVKNADGTTKTPTPPAPGTGISALTVGVKGQGVRVTRAQSTTEGVMQSGKWYYADTTTRPTTYYEAKSGVVANGQWYTDPNAAAAANKGTYPSPMTLVGAATLDTSRFPQSGTFTVELDGFGLTLNGDIPQKLATLTINSDKNYAVDNRDLGTVLQPTVTGNVVRNYGSVSSTFTLNLTNAALSGKIDLVGGTNTVNLTSAGVTGDIIMNGTTTVNGNTSYNRQSLVVNADNGDKSSYNSDIGGEVKITGDASNVSLVNARSASGFNVTYKGNGNGTINVNGTTNVGTLTFNTRLVGTESNRSIQFPTVNIKGGTVATITNTGDFSTAQAKVTVGGVNVEGAVISSAITMAGDADVKIQQGTTGGAAITVPKGRLSIEGNSGAPTTVGAITVGSAGTAVSLSVTGTKVTGGTITNNSGTNLTLSIPETGKPADHAYTFGNLFLGNYAGGGIKRGTFDEVVDTAQKQLWFDSKVAFRVQLLSGKWTCYNSDELGQAFSDLGEDKSGLYTTTASDALVVLSGQEAAKAILMHNGDKDWATIGYSESSVFMLPTMMFGTPVSEWTNDDGTIVKDFRMTTSQYGSASVNLYYKRSVDIATGITKIQSYPEGVRAVLKGNVITLSGAVRGNGSGIASILVTLTTNIKETDSSDGKLKEVAVEVAYNTRTKETYFVSLDNTADAAALGIKVEENRLTMNNGTVVYTVDGAGLGVPANNLFVYDGSTEIKASVSKNGVTNAAKQALIDKIEVGEFHWKSAYGVWEGVNAALKTYNSESTVKNWVSTAQSNVWRNGLKDANGVWVVLSDGTILATHTGTYNSSTGDGAKIAAAFSQAWLVPYLQVTVTDFTSDYSTITANLVPSYRIVVGEDPFDPTKPNYVVSGQSGKSLGTLTGSMNGGVVVTFPGLSGLTWAHQDNTYGYQRGAATLADSTTVANAWEFNHAGAKDGLGTVVFNTTQPLVKLDHQEDGTNSKGDTTAEALYYNTLQAAVNDTLPQAVGKEDKITVEGAYQGSYAISVSGLARTFEVTVKGEKRLEVPSSSLIKSTVAAADGGGNTWTVQLLEDTVKPTNTNITITSVTGGTARVSSNPAAEGQTVTITLVPGTGYVSNGVTVRTAAGAIVPVTGSGNAYTFTMPSGSVTVTPAFVAGSGTTAAAASVVVSNSNMGTATTTALSGQVTGGSVVGVTTYPNMGYRTMGVNVTTNGGSTNAVRTGDNSFNFTVPVNATAVTVTPVYDIDNGTRFADVWSTSYYSNAVAWAVGKGIIGGQSTYSFGSNYNCKRADMMVMLYRAAGQPSVANVRNPFVDVSPSDYYYNAVIWAYSNGITGGVDTTHFGPSQSVTRAQTVTFLYRYAGQPAVGTNSGFYDVSSKDYYAKAVAWAVNQGITNGKTTTSFAPGSNCLRAEIATFLYRDLTGTRA